MKKINAIALLSAGFACGIAFTVFMVASGSKPAQAEGGVVPQQFDTSWAHCIYIHTDSLVVPGQLSCVPK